MPTLSETDVLAPWCDRMRNSGFEVYSEVRFRGVRADVVADNEELVIVAEGKTVLTDAVIEQARRWQGISDYTYIVVSRPERVTPEFEARVRRIEELRLSLVLVNGSKLQTRVERRNMNADTKALRAALHPHQKHWAAAGSQKEQWTPEREWLEKFERELRRGPIATAMLERIVGPSPWGSGIKTRNQVEKLYRSGKLPWAEKVGLEYIHA